MVRAHANRRSNDRVLEDGAVSLGSCSLALTEMPVLVEAFRRAEMACGVVSELGQHLGAEDPLAGAAAQAFGVSRAETRSTV